MKIRILRYVFGVMFLSLGLTSQHALADGAGSIVFKSGDVQVTRANKPVATILVNDPIFAGDSVETKNGRVQLELTDGTKISLQPYTVYKIEKYVFNDEQGNPNAMHASMSKGGLRTMTGSISQNAANYILRTPYATINSQKADFTLTQNGVLKLVASQGNIDVCSTGGCLSAAGGQTITIKEANKPPQLAN